MFKTKSTKRALLLSALSLLLCVSMLVGSTFAWFTDSVTSGNNKIVSGNLDVELEYKKVVDGVASEWTTVKDKTDIFNPEALWEPGHVEVVYLKVSNLGSLELKYQLGVNVIKETLGKTETGADIKLSKYLVFKTVETDAFTTYTDREAVKLAAGTEKGLKDYNGKTTALEVGGEDYVTLIVYMPETVGNEANYRGTDIPTIELGINLYATQFTAEDDSFGDDYDKNSWVDGMKVYNAADLVSALANKDKVILVNDIETTDVIELKKDVAINLNGKTLSASLDVSDDVEISIENGTITNGNMDVSGIQVNKGDVTLSNVEITSARHAVRVEGGNVTINDGIYKVSGSGRLTQHALNVSDGANVTINGGTFIGPKGLNADSGAAVNVQANSTVTINGGNFSKGLNNTLANAGTLIVKGGTFDQNPAAYVANGYKAVPNTDGTYTVLKGDVLVTNSAELFDAINAGKTEIAMAPGNYVMPDGFSDAHDTYNKNGYNDGFAGVNLKNKSLTLIGAGGVVIDASGIDTRDQFVTGANLTFDGVTVNFGTENYMGFANVNNLTYKNGATNGKQCLMGENVAFENCDLNANGAEHTVWTYGAKNISFTDCDFTYGDRGINCYKDQDIEGGKQVVNFTNCTFTTTNAASLGAVEINSSPFSVGIDVTMNGCTAPAYGQLAYISEYDTTAGSKTNITVDGKDVYVVAVGNKWANNDTDANVLKAALSANEKNINIFLLEDIAIDIGCYWNMGGANTESITIDGNGKVLTLSSTYRSYFNLANENGVLNLKNMTLTNLHKGTHFFDYTTHFNCDVVAKDIVFAKSPLVTGGAKAVFTDCEFSQAGTDIYGLWIMSGSDVTVNGGELKTDRGFKIADEDSAKEKTLLRVTDTKFNNTKKAAVLVTTDYGAEITLSNVDISNCTADSTNAVWIDDGRTATADKVVVTGGSVITEP